MINQIRLVAAVAILLLVVAVDFASKLLSIMADGFLVGVLAVVVWPLVKRKKAP